MMPTFLITQCGPKGRQNWQTLCSRCTATDCVRAARHDKQCCHLSLGNSSDTTWNRKNDFTMCLVVLMQLNSVSNFVLECYYLWFTPDSIQTDFVDGFLSVQLPRNRSTTLCSPIFLCRLGHQVHAFWLRKTRLLGPQRMLLIAFCLTNLHW
jgi:hypothetical protein